MKCSANYDRDDNASVGYSNSTRAYSSAHALTIGLLSPFVVLTRVDWPIDSPPVQAPHL